MFFKLYQTINKNTMFVGIIAMTPPSNSFEGYDFIEDMEALMEEGYSIIPTTLAAYLDFKLHQDLEDISNFVDLKTQNITC